MPDEPPPSGMSKTDLNLTVGVQDRPCARCVKRSIGHLCHDEPREPGKATKVEQDNVVGSGEGLLKQEGIPADGLSRRAEQEQVEQPFLQGPGLDLGTTTLPTTTQSDPAQLTPSSPVLGAQNQFSEAESQQRKLGHSVTPFYIMLILSKLLATVIGASVGRISSMICTITTRHICSMRPRSRMNTIYSTTF